MVRRRVRCKGKRKARRKKVATDTIEAGLKDVYIGHRSLKTMVTSAIEVYNRETNGALLGRRSTHEINGRKMSLVSIKAVYPFQTDRRMPSEVEHGNVAAFKRFLRATESLKTEIIGGYHSHPYPYESIRLSEGDINSVKEDTQAMEKIGQERVKKGWLEVLLSIEKKEYKKPKKPEWYICDYIKRIRVRVRTREKTGYDVIISAYWVYPKSQKMTKEKKPLDWDMKVKEVAVYVPWIIE